MVKIGDHTQCPQCDAMGRVVWVSQDGKLAGIQCLRHHNQLSRGPSELGSTVRLQTKPDKNMVFLIEIGTATTHVSAKE